MQERDSREPIKSISLLYDSAYPNVQALLIRRWFALRGGVGSSVRRVARQTPARVQYSRLEPPASVVLSGRQPGVCFFQIIQLTD